MVSVTRHVFVIHSEDSKSQLSSGTRLWETVREIYLLQEGRTIMGWGVEKDLLEEGSDTVQCLCLWALKFVCWVSTLFNICGSSSPSYMFSKVNMIELIPVEYSASSLPKEIQFQHDSSDSILYHLSFHVTFGLTTKKYEDMLQI